MDGLIGVGTNGQQFPDLVGLIIADRLSQPVGQIHFSTSRDPNIFPCHLPLFKINRNRFDPLSDARQLKGARLKPGEFKINCRICGLDV